MGTKKERILSYLMIGIVITICSIKCQEEQYEIKFVKQVYSILPQIPSDYNIVKQINLGAKTTNNVGTQIITQGSGRFVQKQKPDYYVVKSTDTQHQMKRYNFIQGKDIFTSEYVQSHIREQNKNNHPSLPLERQTQKITHKTQKKSQTPINIVTPKIPQKISSQKKKQETVDQKSNQLYNEFKNIEILKQKNLRGVFDNTISAKSGNKDLIKLIGYISIGLILAFAIIKRASKLQPSLPRQNQQRKQLRLRNTVEDDDQSVSSSQSDQ